MTVIMDQLDGGRAVKGISGWEFTRVAKVTELAGSGQNRIVDAVNQVIQAVGDIGTEHPLISTSRIVKFTPRVVSASVVDVNIEYKEGSFSFENTTRINIGTSVSQVESNTDANGDPILVEYQYPTDYQLDPQKAGKTIKQGGTIQRPAPESTLVIKRRETASPGDKSRIYSGKANSVSWSLDPTSDPRQWFCYSITGESDDGGATYDVEYTFHYREETWDQEVMFINPDDGRPPPDLVVGTGLKIVRRVKTIDFNGLGLP